MTVSSPIIQVNGVFSKWVLGVCSVFIVIYFSWLGFAVADIKVVTAVVGVRVEENKRRLDLLSPSIQRLEKAVDQGILPSAAARLEKLEAHVEALHRTRGSNE